MNESPKEDLNENMFYLENLAVHHSEKYIWWQCNINIEETILQSVLMITFYFNFFSSVQHSDIVNAMQHLYKIK